MDWYGAQYSLCSLHCMQNSDWYLSYYCKKKIRPLVDVPDLKGWTPLHFACSFNNLELVQLLLDARADPHARYYSVITYVAVMM